MKQIVTIFLAVMITILGLIPELNTVSAIENTDEINNLQFDAKGIKEPAEGEAIPNKVTLVSKDGKSLITPDVESEISWYVRDESGNWDCIAKDGAEKFESGKVYRLKLEMKNLGIDGTIREGSLKIQLNKFNLSTDTFDNVNDGYVTLAGDNRVSFAVYSDEIIIDENKEIAPIEAQDKDKEVNVDKNIMKASEASVSEAKNADPNVTLDILKYNQDGHLSQLPQEWFMQERVDSAVSLEISGDDYSMDLPYLVIKVPKTNKIKDVKFIDSMAGKTERYEDGDFQYVKYTFPRLTGGIRYAYQYSFAFDGHFAKAGESINVEANLYDRNGNLIGEVKKEYIAKKVDFEIWSHSGNSAMPYIKKVDTDNGHDCTVRGQTDKSDDPMTYPGYSSTTNVYAAIFPKRIDGLANDVGIEYPENIKIVYTYAEDEEGFRENSDEKGTKHYVKGTDVENDYTFKHIDGSNVYEFIINKPNFDYINDNYDGYAVVQAKGNRSTLVSSILKQDVVHVGKELPIKMDFYINVDKDGNNGTHIGTRVENFTFQSYPYNPYSNTAYYKRAFGIADLERNTILHPEYYYSDGEIYKSNYSLREMGGIPLISFVVNDNNGSSIKEQFSGGRTTEVKEIYSKLIPEGTYFRNVKINVKPTGGVRNNGNPYNKKHVDDVIKAINNGNNKLYGIEESGKETLIRDNIQYDELVTIDDISAKYIEIVLRFENNISLDNVQLCMQERQWFVEEEFDKLKLLQDDNKIDYFSMTAFAVYNKDEDKIVKNPYHNASQFTNEKCYFSVLPLHPTIDQHIGDNQTVEYIGNSEFEYMVGPNFPFHTADHTIPYGKLEKIQNVKTITLLPPGYEYTGEYTKVKETPKLRSDWKRYPQNAPDPKVLTVDDFQGSGMTAVIVCYGNVPVERSYPVNLKLRATKNVLQGESDFVTYLTYDDNDFVRPVDSEKDYIDELDLDQDGDTNEVFMQGHNKVTFIPPLELILTNRVSLASNYTNQVTGDVGSNVNFKISLFNNSISDISKLDVIDVLPHEGDHSISPNEDGKYYNRNSQYAINLTGPIEDANPAALLDTYEFFYQTDNQGKDLESVRDGKWLRKDEITDFSSVRSFKVVLKDGKILKSKGDVNIIIPSIIPKETKITENTAIAYNSSAFSTDGINYNEGNSTTIKIVKYNLSGIAYLDLENNGKFDEGKDVLYKGTKIQLFNEDGSEALDLAGKKMICESGEDGRFNFDLYKRGKYYAVFTKQDDQIFNNKIGEGETANSILPESIEGSTAKTSIFTLSPAHLSEVKNVALLPDYNVKITITAGSDEKVYDGTPLAKDVVTVEGLPDGFKVEAEAKGTITDVGTVDNVVESYKILYKDGKDVTDLFTNVKVVKGSLKIKPAELTVVTGSAEKSYDGKPLTNSEAKLEGLVENDKDKATIHATGSQTEVGSSDNTYEIEWKEDIANNYKLTENLGTLKVTKNKEKITITAGSDEKVYDGTPLAKDVVTVEGLPDGFKVEAEAKGTITDVGTVDNVVEGYKILYKDGKDVTDLFTNVEVVNGSLKIKPAELKVVTGSAEKSYDGKPLTNSEAKVEGLVENDKDKATIHATGSQTEVGSSDNTYEIEWKEDIANNYKITENLGTLKVTAANKPNPTKPKLPNMEKSNSSKPNPPNTGDNGIIPYMIIGEFTALVLLLIVRKRKIR